MVLRAVFVYLNALAVLLVHAPVARVLHLSIVALELAEAVRHVIVPLALIGVAVGVNQPTLSPGHVIMPMPDVFSPVQPQLGAKALAEAIMRLLAYVYSSII